MFMPNYKEVDPFLSIDQEN